jgi:hypothetical protein
MAFWGLSLASEEFLSKKWDSEASFAKICLVALNLSGILRCRKQIGEIAKDILFLYL